MRLKPILHGPFAKRRKLAVVDSRSHLQHSYDYQFKPLRRD